MNNQDDLHNDLHDGLDPKLQQLYRQLPKEQPSAELDAKILDAAKISIPKKTHHWQAPFALAASVVMVSSVVLYLHDENPAVFKASAPATLPPTIEVAKPLVQNDADRTANAELSANEADRKPVSQKTKNAPTAKSDNVQTTNADVLKDNNLTALAEKKADIGNPADQMAKATIANTPEKSMQAAAIAKEQEAQQAKAATDKFAAAAYAPAPMIAPAPQMQPQPEVTEQNSLKAGSMQASRLQDSNRANRQWSAVSTESDQPAGLERSNDVTALAAAPMAPPPMNAGSLAGAAMPMAKQRLNRNEPKADYAQNISAPVLNIEGVVLGMNREQLITQGLTCYVDVCHLDVSQPQQETYWGMPAQNAHLTAFLSHHVVSKLVLQQKIAQLDPVKAALSNVGIASQQSCNEEKGTLLMSRQLGTNIFNLRSIGMGLSLTICQQTKSLK